MRPLFMMSFILLASQGASAYAAEPLTATMYKNPQCGCCEEYADYMRDHGFTVTVEPTHDLPLIKKMNGVPGDLEGCHTMALGGYVIEGHVPIDAIMRLLEEKPDIKGISLPGMPQGSPGMSGTKTEPFTIYEIGSDQPSVYAVE